MMSQRTLPDHPDINQLKRQAKELLLAARSADPAALERMRTVPEFARRSADEPARAAFALHDAQSAIAREYGYPSWNALSQHVEEKTLGFDDAVREFVEAATDGRRDRAERLLTIHPGIAHASFHAALVLGDAERVAARLSEDPSLARQAGGPRGWEPLLYICHTSLGHGVTDTAGLVAIARRLLELGADANTRFPWLHHGVRRPVLWGATLVTCDLPLSEVLLRAGANPNDGVTLTLAAGAGDTAALDVLFANGADPNQPWATDGSATLYASLLWATNPAGAYWLLAHGADPDPVCPGNGETPLHVAARRWDLPLVEALVARGADVSRQRSDGRTPYAVAELNGNRAVADWLLRNGASADLQPVDRLVAACSRGDLSAAQALLAELPTLRTAIGAEHYAVLHSAAERDDAEVVAALLTCGFDPNRGDEEIGKTALHSAAMAGAANAARILLAHGASVTVQDREFNAPPLVWAAEGSRSQGCAGTDHAAVGRLLLEAGSPTAWQPGEEPGEAILEIIDHWRRALPQ
jgi:Ankyrin repeats (3 copies)